MGIISHPATFSSNSNNNNNIAILSPLQPSYIKDKARTSKVSMHLGRRKSTFCRMEMNAMNSEGLVNVIYNKAWVNEWAEEF